jgi:hypothetical protein
MHPSSGGSFVSFSMSFKNFITVLNHIFWISQTEKLTISSASVYVIIVNEVLIFKLENINSEGSLHINSTLYFQLQSLQSNVILAQ